MFKKTFKKIIWLLARPTAFFIIVGLIFGIFFVITNPPGFGLDERAHFLRSYEIAQGNFLPTKTGANNHLGAELPKDLTQWVTVSTSDLLDNNNNLSIYKRHDAEPKRYTVFFHEKFSTQKVDDSLSNSQLAGTDNYSPIGYLHLALAVWIGEALHLGFLYILYLARFVNLMVYFLIVYIAIRIIPRYKWLLAMVALWPVALFQASIVSVDPVINSISFLLFALLIKYWHQKDGTLSIAQAILPVLLISILAVTKQPYILLFIPFLFIPNRIFSSKRRAFICKAFWVLVPILAAIIWLEIDKSNSLQAMNIGGVNFTKQLDFVLHDPLRFIGVILNTFFQAADGYFGSMVGEIGDRMIGISIIYLAILSCLTVGIASILSKDQDKKSRDIVSSKKNISVILVVAIGIIGAISLSLYLGFTPVGASIIEGIQGRYFLPLIPFLGLALAPLIPLKLTVKKERAVLIMTTSSIFLLIITAALYTIVNY